jgi:transposase
MALPAASHSRDLTDEQWGLIGPFLPKLTRRKDGRGRPWLENRAVLNGILWILRTGAPWADLPDRYPSYQTCHRRFQHWVRCGVLKDILSVLAEALHDEGYLDLRETFIDGSFAPAKKGGAGVGTTKRAKGSKIMRSPIVMGGRSLFTLTAPHRMKSRSSRPRWPTGWCRRCPNDSLGTTRTSPTTSMRSSRSAASNSSRLTAATARTGRRMVARSAGIDADGRWNGCLPGCRTIDASSCGTNATRRISWACCTLLVG